MTTKNQPDTDQELADKFIDDLVAKLTKKYGDEIDFIILYGSAAKGNFVKGASDIDLAVQVKNQFVVKEISDYSADIFWELDKKHGMGFKEYLANAEASNPVESLIRTAENKAFLYTPIFVLGPNDLNWQNGKAKRKDWKVLSTLFVSTGTIFLKFKEEGKILYGRDIRKEINVNLTFWERWKGICIPVYFSLLAFPMYLVSKKRAVTYSTKSILWDLESALLYRKKLIKDRESQLEELKNQAVIEFENSQTLKLLGLHTMAKYELMPKEKFEIVDEALHYKHNGFDKPTSDAINFSTRTLYFILQLNFVALVRH